MAQRTWVPGRSCGSVPQRPIQRSLCQPKRIQLERAARKSSLTPSGRNTPVEGEAPSARTPLLQRDRAAQRKGSLGVLEIRVVRGPRLTDSAIGRGSSAHALRSPRTSESTVSCCDWRLRSWSSIHDTTYSSDAGRCSMSGVVQWRHNPELRVPRVSSPHSAQMTRIVSTDTGVSPQIFRTFKSKHEVY